MLQSEDGLAKTNWMDSSRNRPALGLHSERTTHRLMLCTPRPSIDGRYERRGCYIALDKGCMGVRHQHAGRSAILRVLVHLGHLCSKCLVVILSLVTGGPSAVAAMGMW